MEGKARNWAGRALLELAVALERTVAGQKVWHQHQERRNKVLVAASRLGMSPEVMAERLRLSPGTVRNLLRPTGEQPGE